MAQLLWDGGSTIFVFVTWHFET